MPWQSSFTTRRPRRLPVSQVSNATPGNGRREAAREGERDEEYTGNGENRRRERRKERRFQSLREKDEH